MEKISCENFYLRKSNNSNLQIVDVREAVEYQSEHLEGTVNVPLSCLAKSLEKIKKDGPVYLLCRSGARSNQAAQELQKNGYEKIVIVEGGLESLKPLGCALIKGETKAWAMDRQVRLGAGLMTLIGILGFWLIHPGFLFLPVFVSCGLIFSAVTNTCGMAMILGRCPWNQA